MSIVIGIPAYNEEENVAKVILESRKYGAVVVVDDGSTDGTNKNAAQSGAVVIAHKGNLGYGKSIADLFSYAQKGNYDVLITLDADGQHNPNEIPRFLERLKSADIVIGNRFNSDSNTPLYRKLGVQFFSYFNRVNDSQCGFRAYSKQAINAICGSLYDHGMGASVEILKLSQSRNLSVAEVPCTVTYGVEKHSQNPVRHGFNLILTFFWLAVWDKPAKSLVPCGLLALFGAFVAGAQTLSLYAQFHVVVFSWALLSVGLFICTMLIFNMLVFVVCFKNRKCA